MTLSINLITGIIGFALMLAGLVFMRTDVIALPCTGIGGSILATAIVNWIFMRQWHGLPIPQIAEALAHKTEFMRTRQEAELTFIVDRGRIKLEKRHKYSVRNPSWYKRTYTISVFTDASRAALYDSCGFQIIIEPDGTKLEGDKLQAFIRKEYGKHFFYKTYDLQPGDSNAFEFRSIDYYRLLDRLIWTVQDLSDGFLVRIINKTGISNPFEIKINHHRDGEILSQLKHLDVAGEIIFEFNSEILPYQGFEIMWDITNITKVA